MGRKWVRVFHYKIARPEIAEKANFIRNANKEIIQIGVSLRSFISYFEQRPSYEFRDIVANLIKRGIRFRNFILDPNCPLAKEYSYYVDEKLRKDELSKRCESSIKKLKEIGKEFDEVKKGAFEIFTYDNIPRFFMLCVDPEEENGKMMISFYIYGYRRADAPVLFIEKSHDPELFSKYYECAKRLISQSKVLST